MFSLIRPSGLIVFLAVCILFTITTANLSPKASSRKFCSGTRKRIDGLQTARPRPSHFRRNGKRTRSATDGWYCGIDFYDALDCHQPCSSPADCALGETCFSGIVCNAPNPNNWCGNSDTGVVDCESPCPYSFTGECPTGDICWSDVTSCSGVSPTPTPTPTTTATTTPTGTPTSPPAVDVQGYYVMTWTGGSAVPDTATMSVAFSGWADINKVISESKGIYHLLEGDKYISIGGGRSDTGYWSSSVIKIVNDALSNGEFSDYIGICYDIEGGSVDLTNEFIGSFQLAKNLGYKVFVTISHSAPYDISDRDTIMDAVLSSDYVDMVSPQLYTTGLETENDYTITSGYRWENYVNCKPAFVPSIVQASFYSDAQTYFSAIGIPTNGFVQWAAIA